MEKLLNKIKLKKNDKNTLVEYIKCFIENEKSEELFKSNSEYKKIKDFINKIGN